MGMGVSCETQSPVHQNRNCFVVFFLLSFLPSFFPLFLFFLLVYLLV